MNLMNQPVSSIMSREVIKVSPSQNLGDAFFMMRNNQIHHLVVIEDEKLAGVLSANDILDTSTKREDWAELPIKNHMTTRLAKMNQGDPIAAAAKIFNDYWFHSLPVVDDKDAVVGIITLLDVTRYMYKVLYED